MRLPRFTVTLLFILSCCTVWGQSPVMDSLNQIIRENKQDKEEVQALNRMANEYARNDMAKAKYCLYRSLSICDHLKNNVLLGTTYSELVTVELNTGQKDSSLYFLNRLRDLSLHDPAWQLHNDYYFTAGLFYKIQGNYKAALPYMNETMNAYIKSVKEDPSVENKTSLAGQYLNVGNVYLHLAQYRLAVQFHLRALKLFDEINNRRGLSFCYQSIGSDFISLSQFKQALPYTRNALALKTELHDKRGITTALAELGDIYKGLSQYDSALALDEQALKKIQEMNLTTEEAKMYFDMAKTYELKQDPARAEAYLKKSAELAVRIGDSSRQAAVNSELIALRTSVKKKTIEEKQLVSSLNTSIRTGDRNTELQNYRYLSAHYAENKEFDKSLTYLKKYYSLNDSIQNNDLQMQLRNLEEQYHLDKKEKEIALLKKDQQLSQLSLQKNKTFQIAGLIFIFFLALTGFLIFNRYRIISKNKRLIEMEKMRNHIARDLHDDIGSTLTSIHIISKVSLQDKNTGSEDMASNMKKIKERTSSIMESMSDIVWTINPQNDSMAQMLIRMREFAAEILEPLNIQYSFKEEGDIASVQMDIKKRKDFYLLFKEAINNAAKHSSCRSLNIYLKQDQHNLRMIIEDDGKGFDQNDIKPGNGLENMRARAKAMNAELKMETARGKNTRISLDLSIT